MKLRTLKIHSFRGIKEWSWDLSQRSGVLLGPNGSGKSSVADATDFLLTGRIRRLTGEGAGDLSLGKHAAHIDSEDGNGWVEGTFVGESNGDPIVIRRSLAAPSDLDTLSGAISGLEPFLKHASTSGVHLLTRREILRFISTRPQERAQSVAALLETSQIEDLRKEIGGAANDAKKQLQSAQQSHGFAVQSVLDCFDPAPDDFEGVLATVNQCRAEHGSDAVQSLDGSPDLKAGLEWHGAETHPLQSSSVKAQLHSLRAWVDEGAEEWHGRCLQYHDRVQDLWRDKERAKAARASLLIRDGLELLDEDECPLCLSSWDRSELQTLLEERLEEARDVAAQLESLENQYRELLKEAESVVDKGKQLVEACEGHAELSLAEISALVSVGSTVQDEICTPGDAERQGQVREASLAGFSKTPALSQEIAALEKAGAALADPSGLQKAWDELTKAGAALERLEEAKSEERQCEAVHDQLKRASRLFIKSRDEVLGRVYDAIAARFETLYRAVHGEDEEAFVANFKPTTAGLNLAVDFHGRGAHPPVAFHSEGHQDSMGVLLFLVLAEHLGDGRLPFVLLDDVVMSVDAGHRRGVAEVMRTEFGNTQFIITTHDRVWWRQLRALNVVPAQTAIEFRGWQIDMGPHIIEGTSDTLQESRDKLEANDVPGAAHALRRGLEWALREICHGIGALVRFRADDQWSAGDLVSGLMVRYRELLGAATKAAKSWDDEAKVLALKELDEKRKGVYTSFKEDEWAVNMVVHWNSWADLTEQDFRPVLESYERLLDLFLCPACSGFLRVSLTDARETGVRCDCDATSWNLKRKPAN